jgi:zinc-ribbon domain
MKIIVAIIMGFLSGWLIYMAAAMLYTEMFFTDGEPSSAIFFTIFFFFGGWVLSTVILVRGAKTISKVFSRGFLLGAAEWLAMIPVGIFFSGKALTKTVTQSAGSNAEIAGAMIGAGLVSFVTGGIAMAMAIICLLGFTVSYFMAREMKPETAGLTRTCPECGELIQTAARKCKHCGAKIPQGE